MPEKPVHHGRDHRPGGEDPIPIGMPYLAGTPGGLTVASGTTGLLLNLDPATINWGTDDGAETASDYFALQDPGSGTHEIALLEKGLYVIDAWADFSQISPAPAAGSVAAISLTNTIYVIGGSGTELWKADVIASGYVAKPSIRAMLNWPSTTPPIYHGIQIYQNSGASVGNVTVNFMVRRLYAGNTGF